MPLYVARGRCTSSALLKKRVQACFEAGALATGCKADIRWGEYRSPRSEGELADGRSL